MKNLFQRILIVFIPILTIVSLGINASAIVKPPEGSYTYDSWGKSIPSYSGYTTESVYYLEDMDTTALNAAQDLFVYRDDLYIVDTGNNRIVILDSAFKLKKIIAKFIDADQKETTLKNANGIFVSNDLMYIADTDNARVIVSDLNGSIVKTYNKPVGNTIPKDFIFKPKKIAVDKAGYLYVLAEGVFQGLVCYDDNCNFAGFYGSNKVVMDFQMMVTMMWKSLMTKEQKGKLIRFIPVEINNIFIDDNDFIFNVTKGAFNNNNQTSGQLQMLNPLGNNIMRYNSTDVAMSGGAIYPHNIYGDVEYTWDGSGLVQSALIDVNVDKEGIITVLDQVRGRLFQYDQESNLLFIFGGISDQKGGFSQPSAVEKAGDNYVVLDAVKNNITVFTPTFYSQLVKQADSLYTQGLYSQAMGLWEDVLQLNSTNVLAYKSIGKKYLQDKNYGKALEYLKLGDDRVSYSMAYRQYRKQYLRDHLLVVLAGIILIPIILVKIIQFLLIRLGIRPKNRLQKK